MTRAETLKIIGVLQINYPDAFRALTDDQLQMVVTLWQSVLSGETYQDVQAAVIAFIATDTGRFMPPVGAIKQQLIKLRHVGDMTDGEAWALVAKAIRNSAYHSVEEFAKLPEMVKKIVGSPSQLYEWAISDHFNAEVASSNFMRAYNARVKADRELQSLPECVKKVLEIGADRMSAAARLEGGAADE